MRACVPDELSSFSLFFAYSFHTKNTKKADLQRHGRKSIHIHINARLDYPHQHNRSFLVRGRMHVCCVPVRQSLLEIYMTNSFARSSKTKTKCRRLCDAPQSTCAVCYYYHSIMQAFIQLTPFPLGRPLVPFDVVAPRLRTSSR